ncbi:P-loop NTPase [Mucilaginibacter sp. HD30]
MARDKNRIGYVRYVIGYLKDNPKIWNGVGYGTFEAFVESPALIRAFLKNHQMEFHNVLVDLGKLESVSKGISKALKGNSIDAAEETLEFLNKSFSLPIDFRQFVQGIIRRDPKLLIYLNDEKTNTEFEFHGATVIDNSYKKQILDGHKYSKFDFYLNKINKKAQWFGVFQNFSWDVSRSINAEILEKVEDFSPDFAECKIFVLTGPGGVGKTIALRRLSSQILNDYHILWVSDLAKFENNDFNQFNSSEKWLLIIDDWEKAKLAEGKNSVFLETLLEYENLTIIISDYNSTNKEYLPFLSENGELRLNMNDHEATFAKLVHIHPEWRDAYESFKHNTGMRNSPIYYSLFMLIKKHTKDTKSPAYKKVIHQLNNVVREDLKVVNDSYPGLSRFVYYWAWLCLSNRDFRPLMSWQIFLKICDHFNDKPVLYKRLEFINKENPTIEILSRYISWEQKSLPKLRKYDWFSFHNALIAEALKEKFVEDWHFSDETIFEILDALIDMHENYTAESLCFFGLRFYPLKWKFYKRMLEYRERIPRVLPTLDELFGVDYYLNNIYVFAKYHDEKTCRDVINYLLTGYKQEILDFDDIREIFPTIIDKGCRDIAILEVSQIIKKGKEDLKQYMQDRNNFTEVRTREM